MQESAGDQRKGRSKVIKHCDKTDSVAVKQMVGKRDEAAVSTCTPQPTDGHFFSSSPTFTFKLKFTFTSLSDKLCVLLRHKTLKH